MKLKTVRGYDFFEVASALQKAIRRGDARLAGYWAIEFFESRYVNYVWKRLLTISAEDCWGIITKEVEALYNGFCLVNSKQPPISVDKVNFSPDKKIKGRIFIAKAVILLSEAKKSRDADHLTNFIYDQKTTISDAEIDAELNAARNGKEEIPDYAFDVHTQKGRKKGMTRADFFRDEHHALDPLQKGLFDSVVENL